MAALAEDVMVILKCTGDNSTRSLTHSCFLLYNFCDSGIFMVCSYVLPTFSIHIPGDSVS